MTKNSQEKDAYLAVRTIELRGYEYAKVVTLARSFDLSKKSMEELIHRLSLTHEIRVMTLGERCKLVNVADFHRALVDVVPVQNGLVPVEGRAAV